MPKTWLALTGAEIPTTLQGRIFLGNRQEEEADYHFAFRGRMDESIRKHELFIINNFYILKIMFHMLHGFSILNINGK